MDVRVNVALQDAIDTATSVLDLKAVRQLVDAAHLDAPERRALLDSLHARALELRTGNAGHHGSRGVGDTAVGRALL